jgi:adenosine deaminase
MTETIFRTVLAARETSDKLFLSLAGGRKTMSADMQRAASMFGCDGLLHVVDAPPLPDQLKKPVPELFLAPLPQHLAASLSPLVVGCEPGNEVITTPLKDKGVLTCADFPLPPFFPAKIPDQYAGPCLVEAVENRLRQSSYLLVNFSNSLLARDRVSNFLSLYRLPSRVIDQLKSWKLGVDPGRQKQELAFLKQLPKVDLHCHMGGIAHAGELIEIADACRESCPHLPSKVQSWLDTVANRVKSGDLEGLHRQVPNPKALRTLFPEVPEPFVVSCFIQQFRDNAELLDRFIFGDLIHEDRFVGRDITGYEPLGDLQGSGILQCEPAIRQACTILKRQCREHHVKYLELRCSPVKYTRGGLTPQRVVEILLDELNRDTECTFRLIFIGSRHSRMSEIYQHIELASQCMDKGLRDIVGFDLAGNESSMEPRRLREAFLSVMEKCLRITIHAGETVSAESIWQALYHLNADRIGHGLTLWEKPELYPRLRDRRICLEMCPSSNMQIRGFRDNYLPATHDLPIYPLRQYMEQGLRICVNTDNPGISRTNFTNELHRACRMTPGGLSLWDLLTLIRSGLRAAFIDDDHRNRLLLEAEREISRIITSMPRDPS